MTDTDATNIERPHDGAIAWQTRTINDDAGEPYHGQAILTRRARGRDGAVRRVIDGGDVLKLCDAR